MSGNPAKKGPTPENLSEWRNFAAEYLRAHFEDSTALGDGKIFSRSPLHGEGSIVILPFSACKNGRTVEPYYVAVGQTEPNYFPAYDLDPDEAYSLHLGTRFMLVLGVASVNWSPDDGYDPAANAKEIVARVAPDSTLEHVSLAAMFDVEGEMHAVLRAELDGRPLYIFGRDAPWGFCDKAHLPPPVAYRLHLGAVLLAEPEPDQARREADHD